MSTGDVVTIVSSLVMLAVAIYLVIKMGDM